MMVYCTTTQKVQYTSDSEIIFCFRCHSVWFVHGIFRCVEHFFLCQSLVKLLFSIKTIFFYLISVYSLQLFILLSGLPATLSFSPVLCFSDTSLSHTSSTHFNHTYIYKHGSGCPRITHINIKGILHTFIENLLFSLAKIQFSSHLISS